MPDYVIFNDFYLLITNKGKAFPFFLGKPKRYKMLKFALYGRELFTLILWARCLAIPQDRIG